MDTINISEFWQNTTFSTNSDDKTKSTISCDDHLSSNNSNSTSNSSVNWFKTPHLSCSSAQFTEPGNHLKGCKWSPDGSYLLTNSNDKCLRIFNLPVELSAPQKPLNRMNEPISMKSVVEMQEPSLVYDYSWYPRFNCTDPSSCLLVSTSRSSPVHMWDAHTGALLHSYLAYNQSDELVAAYSLCFSPDGSKLLCGFNKRIRVFDVNLPGRCFTEWVTFKKDGQPGIISCIAHSPTEFNLYAAGSYSKAIGLYHEPEGKMSLMFQGHQGGVTHLLFSPDGTKLYSGGRKDSEILCWDLRNPGHILFSAIRNVETNQRIYFDLDVSGRCLVSGNHNGDISIWDTFVAPDNSIAECDPILPLQLQFKAHSDTVNGVSIHRSLPLISSASGRRHFNTLNNYSDSSDSSDTNDSCDQNFENSVKLWTFPCI